MLPAYAGMILRKIHTWTPPKGAPRVCGDDPTFLVSIDLGGACSPRMRG